MTDLMHTEWKRPRLYLGKIDDNVDIPNLIKIQLDSYIDFLQMGTSKENLKNVGLHAAMQSIFPIKSSSGHIVIEYVHYTLTDPLFEVNECRVRGLTYAGILRAMIRVTMYDRDSNGKPTSIREVKEQEVYLGEMPLMTPTGSFIINGTERVVVSQLHRSPGVFFEHDKGKNHSSGKLLYSARIIPYRGAWLDFEFDVKDILYARIDRRRKMPVTVILKALGYSNDKILDIFYEKEPVRVDYKNKTYSITCDADRLAGTISPIEISGLDGVIVEANQRISARHVRQIKKAEIENLVYPLELLQGRIISHDIFDADSGEIIAGVNTEIDAATIVALEDAGILEFDTSTSMRLIMVTTFQRPCKLIQLIQN